MLGSQARRLAAATVPLLCLPPASAYVFLSFLFLFPPETVGSRTAPSLNVRCKVNAAPTGSGVTSGASIIRARSSSGPELDGARRRLVNARSGGSRSELLVAPGFKFRKSRLTFEMIAA